MSGRGERTEWGLIAQEVERLQALYGESKTSFRKYAREFRIALSVLQGAQGEPSFEERALKFGLPSLDVASAVSRRARDGVALPPGLALLWALEAMDLDTRSTSHPREFRELFRLRYTKEYGPGLVVPPLKRPLRATYKPVSSSFGIEGVVLPTEGLPRASTAPLRRLCALVKDCARALEPYSDWMWRYGKKRSALAAVALLPPELAMSRPHDDLPSHAASALSPPATGSTAVRSQSQGTLPPSPPGAAPAGVSLDMSRVRAKLLETAEVSSLLGHVFVEEESPEPVAAPQRPSEVKRVSGLDAAHSALLLALSARASWPRVDFEQLAARLGLLPEGALESLNEAALEQRGEPVWEGEDPIEMNAAALKELLA